MPEVQQRVIAIIASQFGTAATRDSRFAEDLGADSLDGVEITLELEDEFDVDIPDDVWEGWTTVGDAVDWVAARVGAGR